ncbi:MAG: hypothetical protein KJN62_01470 [Deltaproteobacteria bacterium]|nr:hypothetical protein [Deltaproteobacteria bacterium]
MEFSKKKWLRTVNSATMKSEVPESELQKAVDDYLAVKRLSYYRIPDSFFRWLASGKFIGRVYHENAPERIKKWFRWMFGGKPDNTIIIPIGNGLALSLLLELKTQDSKGRAVGQLHGKQKHHEDEWIVCRSIDSAISEINKFILLSDKIKKWIKEYKKI